jgi:predicted house-cleaning noncanonical NTP pyrophosphatase (MazG superfamily)
MPSFYFKKLVRDQVLQRCLDDPKVKTHYTVLDETTFKKSLIAKIHEEADEIPVVDKKDDEVLSEIADVQAVIDALTQAYGYTKEDVAGAQSKKEAKAGAFEKRAYIEKVDLDDDSEWVAYFRKSPDKYEEIL